MGERERRGWVGGGEQIWEGHSYLRWFKVWSVPVCNNIFHHPILLHAILSPEDLLRQKKYDTKKEGKKNRKLIGDFKLVKSCLFADI